MSTAGAITITMPLPQPEKAGQYALRVPRFESESALAAVVDAVGAGAGLWHAQTLRQRIQLLRRLKQRTTAACVSLGTAMTKARRPLRVLLPCAHSCVGAGSQTLLWHACICIRSSEL